MKIAVVNNCVPFVYGGAELLADGLQAKLLEYGHQALVVKIPFKWYPPQEILDHMMACRLLQLENVDKVIALKFPVYYLKHPNKVLWLVHQFRQAYDLWDTPYQNIPKTAEGLRIKATIVHSDNCLLKEARSIYAISRVVSDRLKKYNDIYSTVLYPPLADASQYFSKEYGDYVFFPSRINSSKRQHLAIEAMKHVRTGVKLLIAGNPDTEGEVTLLKSLVRKNDLEHKVRIIARWISEEEKREALASALGCVFLPYNEDYGYVSLEAFYSCKPIITCTDSGGPLEFVDHGISGFAVYPSPETIAESLDRLYSDKAAAEKMGRAGYEKMLSLNISWENVIRRMTE